MKLLAAMVLVSAALTTNAYAGDVFIEYEGVKYNIKAKKVLDKDTMIAICKYSESGPLYGYYVFILDNNNKILFRSSSSGDSKPRIETLGFINEGEKKGIYMVYATEEGNSLSVFYNAHNTFKQFILSEEAEYTIMDLNSDGTEEILVSVYELSEFYGADEYTMIFKEKIYNITDAGVSEVKDYRKYKDFFKNKLKEYESIEYLIKENKEKDKQRYIINFDIYKMLLNKYIVRSKNIISEETVN